MFLPGKSQGQRSLVGCRLWGRTESDMTEVTQQQQQYALLIFLQHFYDKQISMHCGRERYLLRRLASWFVRGLEGHINKSMITGYEVEPGNHRCVIGSCWSRKNFYIQLLTTLWGNILNLFSIFILEMRP